MPVEVGARRNALRARSRNSGGEVSARVHVAEMQRARLLAAAVLVIEEQGWSGASVAHITARARVSRRTFYDLFANRDECLVAVLQDAVEQVAAEIVMADLEGLAWRERMRGGLLAVLSFFEREPALARLCVVQSLQGGPQVLEWREGIVQDLARIVDEGRRESPRARLCTILTAEGLVGGVFAIVYARLSSHRRHEPLRSLLGELMSLIVLPYLGPDIARREQQRPLPPRPRTKRTVRERDRGTALERDALADIPMRLTYRTARVLEAIAEQPGVSNRIVADYAGIADQGQISKLLTRLERLGLVANDGEGPIKGEPNAWTLTPTGQHVTDGIRLHTTRRDTQEHGQAVVAR